MKKAIVILFVTLLLAQGLGMRNASVAKKIAELKNEWVVVKYTYQENGLRGLTCLELKGKQIEMQFARICVPPDAAWPDCFPPVNGRVNVLYSGGSWCATVEGCLQLRTVGKFKKCIDVGPGNETRMPDPNAPIIPKSDSLPQ